MSTVPPLSVVMPAHNVGRFVDEAIESVLHQTYHEFEFVILDDASADDTAERLRAWEKRDPRIRLFSSSARLGPAGSSNFVVEKARAKLVARMDADDIARPERLARQMELLAENPEVVLVGTLGETINAAGCVVRDADQGRLVRASALAPFGHSSILFRRDAFERIGGYRAAADKWEDIDLYLRLAEVGTILVLRQPLMRHRQSSASTRIADGRDLLEQAMERLHRCLAAYEVGCDYAELMQGVSDRVSSRSFIAAASGALWADQRQGHARRLREKVSSPALTAVIWAAWADFSPATLRMALRTLLRVRNAAAGLRLGSRRQVRWHPLRPLTPGRRRSSREGAGGA